MNLINLMTIHTDWKNRSQYLQVLSAFLIMLCLSLPVSVPAEEIRLSAAASLTDAIKEITAAFQQQNPDAVIIANYGSSGSLARQINQGAPADLYISANSKWMEYLSREQNIVPQSVRLFAINSLVFIGPPKRKISSLEDIVSLSRVAMGSPASVPAGQYAQQAMRTAGIYRQMAAAKKLVMAKDVRQALLYADRGEVDGAFVYRTDALLAEHADTLLAVPMNLHDRIICLMGLTPNGSRNQTALALSRFIAGPEAAPVLRKFGFLLPADTR